MLPTVVHLDDIQAEKTDDGLLIHYEYKLPIKENQRLAIKMFFFLWNSMIGLFACFGLAILIFALIVEKKWEELIPFLLFFPVWFIFLYCFYRVGRSISSGLTGKRPLFEWKITISRDQWHSLFTEAWRHHDKIIPVESIKEINFDQQNRVIAITSGKRIPLTTPLSDPARDWFSEKLSGFLSASSG